MKLFNYMAATMLIACACSAEAQELPKPQTVGGMPLMEAIQARQSSRDINPEATISSQDLSNMLWAAWGITHDGGKRAVATALNRQGLEIFVITHTQVSKYIAETCSLEPVNQGDFTSLLGRKGFATDAPVTIAIVSDSSKESKMEFQHYAAGAASQNIYLYCAQAGLKTVVRYGFDHEGVAKALKLGTDEEVLYLQTVGK